MTKASADRTSSFRDLGSELEWDFFSTPRTMVALHGKGKLPAIASRLVLKRTGDYRIGVEADISAPLVEAQSLSKVLDREIAQEEVVGDSADGRYALQLWVLGHRTSYDLARNQARVRLRRPLVHRVSFASPHSADEAYLSEWYLNGPHSPLPFCRLTKRISEGSLQRVRFGFESPFSTFRLASHGESGGGGHLIIRIPACTVAVSTVPAKYGPRWARPIAIEYDLSSGPIPDADVRKAIGEIVGFVLGCELLCIGHSVFDSEGIVLRAEGQSPWGPGIKDACGQDARPPVDVYEPFEARRAENLLATVASAYLSRRAELCLDEVLWQYWMARRSPLGPNIAQLGAALNKLIDAWFRSSRSASRGVNMAKAEFDALLANEMASIAEKLREYSNGQRIVNRCRNAFQMGVAEKAEVFFEELDLRIGILERDAMRARNAPAHGSLPEQADIPRTMRQWNALQTLFHRAFLKILGYDGVYVDYASRDWASRALEDPVPE